MTGISELINGDLERKQSTFTEYASELQGYLDFLSANKKNPNIRYIETYYLYKLVEKWQPVLGFNESLIKGHLIDIQTPKLEYKTSMSIKEVLDEAEQSSSWLIPSLLQSCGMYILGGDPKTGKSILCYALCHSVCVSGEFLGLPVKKGNVLFLQLEEPMPTISKRFKKAGFGMTANDEDTSILVNFQENNLRIERSFDITTDIDWLIKKIEQHNIDLVIIDSLRKATNKSSFSENTNEFGKLVYSLQQVFNMTNTCGIVIHHLSKVGSDAKRKFNLIDRLAGHTSISAASDGLIGLFDTSANGQEILTLKTKPRDGFPVSLSYEKLTTPEGLWDFRRVDSDGPSTIKETSRIMRYLSKYPDLYLSGRDIADGLGISNTNPELLKGLQYLVDLELIASKYENKRCYYSFSSTNMWVINPVSVRSLVSPAVVDANNLMHCTTKSDIRKLVAEWDNPQKRASLDVLLPGERERVEELIKDWEYQVGETVVITPSPDIYTVTEQTELTGTLNDNSYLVENSNGDTYSVKEFQLSYPADVSIVVEEIEIEEVEIPNVLEVTECSTSTSQPTEN